MLFRSPTPEIAAEPALVEGAPAEIAPIEGAPAAEPAVEAIPAEGEKPAEVEAKPEGEAEVVAPEPIKYTDFKMPEGFKASPEQTEAFSSVLNKYGLTQEAGQELMDLHSNSLKQMAEATSQGQQDVFAKMRSTWRDDFTTQAGNRRDTTLNDAKFALGEAVKDKKERAALDEVLGGVTGAGDHPLLINALARLGRRLRERSAPPQGVPLRGAPANKADQRYGRTK